MSARGARGFTVPHVCCLLLQRGLPPSRQGKLSIAGFTCKSAHLLECGIDLSENDYLVVRVLGTLLAESQTREEDEIASLNNCFSLQTGSDHGSKDFVGAGSERANFLFSLQCHSLAHPVKQEADGFGKLSILIETHVWRSPYAKRCPDGSSDLHPHRSSERRADGVVG
jgi:hypothetical protein